MAQKEKIGFGDFAATLLFGAIPFAAGFLVMASSAYLLPFPLLQVGVLLCATYSIAFGVYHLGNELSIALIGRRALHIRW